MTPREAAEQIIHACGGDPKRTNEAHAVISLVYDEVVAEREACASLVGEMPMAEILLACGEMTAQERRTVRALSTWFAHRIRNRVPRPETGTTT